MPELFGREPPNLDRTLTSIVVQANIIMCNWLNEEMSCRRSLVGKIAKLSDFVATATHSVGQALPARAWSDAERRAFR